MGLSPDSQNVHDSQEIKDHHFQGTDFTHVDSSVTGQEVPSKGPGREGGGPWRDGRPEEEGVSRDLSTCKERLEKVGLGPSTLSDVGVGDRRQMFRVSQAGGE